MGVTLDREWADLLRNRRQRYRSCGDSVTLRQAVAGLVCAGHRHARLRGLRREVHAGSPACSLYLADHVDEHRNAGEPVDRPA